MMEEFSVIVNRQSFYKSSLITFIKVLWEKIDTSSSTPSDANGDIYILWRCISVAYSALNDVYGLNVILIHYSWVHSKITWTVIFLMILTVSECYFSYGYAAWQYDG